MAEPIAYYCDRRHACRCTGLQEGIIWKKDVDNSDSFAQMHADECGGIMLPLYPKSPDFPPVDRGCNACGSANLKKDVFARGMHGTVTQDIVCEDCRANWQAIYTLRELIPAPCECSTWASTDQFSILLTGHNENCRKANIAVAAKHLIQALSDHIKYCPRSMTENMPAKTKEAYDKARRILGDTEP